ncbi:diacylglycerol kinase [Variovorax sp. J22P240]|uniref:diacylglycerol kinase n=1 Tax=unclassified Variovorax TaxID=663243 RepID=UPI0025788DD4|nr:MULTISPECIES: diacylglycerol kinase [unclassified Variovorax]MDL9997788.1 diacylglycerol kinase [Variovorax sp. J22P240]MDM0049558.1 diacylglycerol kinase [Variovorax sp. J22R115]
MSDANPVNPQKSRRGLARVWHATLISVDGFRAGWREAAFRQEVVCAIVMLPSAFWIGRSWVEVAILVSTVVLVLIVELLNSAIEAAIDRIGPEWHSFSKTAKDLGSAAVLLSLVLCSGIWIAALWQRFAT